MCIMNPQCCHRERSLGRTQDPKGDFTWIPLPLKSCNEHLRTFSRGLSRSSFILTSLMCTLYISEYRRRYVKLLKVIMLNLNRELLNCTHASVVRQSAQKLVQRKFEPSTTISINHKAALKFYKFETSVALPFCYIYCRTRVCTICTCAYQKFSALVPSHEMNEIMLHNFFLLSCNSIRIIYAKSHKKRKTG